MRVARVIRLLFVRAVVWLPVGLVICFATHAHAVTCSFKPGNSGKTMQFTIPYSLTVPRDAPVGTVVWESAPMNVPTGHSWKCSTSFKAGTINWVGGAASADQKTDEPIGTTGLAWSVNIADMTQATTTWEIDGASTTYWSVTGPLVLRIKKIGQVGADASVPCCVLGYHTVENQITPLTYKTSNTSTVATRSCKTPSVTVKMGDQNEVRGFQGVGTSLSPVSFSIALKECPEGLNKVSYQLNPNSAIVDASRSVVALDAGSTAKGVGVQLLNSAGNPVALKTKLQFAQYDKQGGNFNIPLQAAYYQTANQIVPGTANTSVAFVMGYN